MILLNIGFINGYIEGDNFGYYYYNDSVFCYSMD